MAAQLTDGGWAEGVVDLNTCNRNEWIVSCRDPMWVAELLRGRMLERLGPDGREGIEPYLLVGEEAARHLFRVAVGQESLVVGERQVAGQLFRALENARARGSSSRVLNGLGAIAGRLVRIAIRRGCVSSSSSGVHSLALSYLRERFHGQPTTVAVVGLGQIGHRVLGQVQQEPGARALACNRTVSADEQERVRPLTELRAVLAESDAAVVCTGARRPVVLPKHLDERSRGSLLVIDIGIPEQVSREGAPEGVEIVGLDELTAFHGASSLGDRDEQRPEVAQELVERAVEELRRFCNEPPFSAVLNAVQSRHREMARNRLPQLTDGRFGYLSDDDRARLEHDMRSLLSEYSNEVFHTIREAAKRRGATEAWAE